MPVPFARASICLLLTVHVLYGQPPDTIRQGGGVDPVQSGCRVRAVSWNIERGQQLNAVHTALVQQSVDVAILQEVDAGARRTGRKDIAAELARRLRMSFVFAAEFEELSQGSPQAPAFHGQAILANRAITSPRLLRFENQSSFWGPRWYLPAWRILQRRTGGRLALVARLGTERSGLVVCNVHLESRGSPELRLKQLQEVITDLQRYPPETPILVAGDFNTKKATEPAIGALLNAGFRKALGEEITTVHGAPLDWVFLRGPVQVYQEAILRSIRASDHFPLSLRIEWTGPECGGGTATDGARSRLAEIEAQRDRKAAYLRPETISSFENALLEVKQRKIVERVTAGMNGLRVGLGNMATASGFALGPEFVREDLARGRLRLEASALVSTRLWQKYELGVAAPSLAGGRILVRAEAIRRDYRSLEFYGMGPDSARQDRTDYRLRDSTVQGIAAVSATRRLKFGGSAGGLWASTGPGQRAELRNTDNLFDGTSAPGLGTANKWFASSVFGQFDYRDDPAGPKSGGNYVFEHSWFHDVSSGRFGFRRWDLDAQQYVPFFNKTRRLALRARMTMTETDPGRQVPFHLTPYLGGADDLRGFRPYRFAGRNAIVYNAEYRWEIFSGLDGALFFDAGKVMPHRGWLAMGDLETSAGFGLRFNARNRTFLRLDAGFSHEGAAVWLKFNDPFLPRLFGAGTRQPRY